MRTCAPSLHVRGQGRCHICTTIRFAIPQNEHATLKVFDLLGREVATLVNEARNAGSYNETFDASKLSSGVYIYRLRAGNFTVTKKFTLMKQVFE